MWGKMRHQCIIKDFSFVVFAASCGTAVMVLLDAWDWFYRHSRQHEAYGYDEIVAFMSLFLLIGMLWIMFRLYKEAVVEVENRKKAEEDLRQLSTELERRIGQRTMQLQSELNERERIEKMLVENHKQLRALSSELTLVEEQERRRIATELHDNIGHALAMASNQLGAFEASLSAQRDKELLSNIKGLVKDSIRYSRSLISELSSPLFYDVPFVSAVAWLAEDVLEKNGIAVRHMVAGDPRIPADDVRVLFLKAIREILVNIVKHAKARSVEISVRAGADELVVAIADDGVGFEESAVSHISPASRQGFGLFTVRERVAHLGGRFSILSKLGQGTTVTLTVPLQKDTAEEAA